MMLSSMFTKILVTKGEISMLTKKAGEREGSAQLPKAMLSGYVYFTNSDLPQIDTCWGSLKGTQRSLSEISG